MANETWKDIHARRWIYAPPEAPRLIGPHTQHPTCAEHCSGRHSTDSMIVCRDCGKTSYRVIVHEWAHSEGHYFNELVPMNGAPPYDPKTPPQCCGRPMVRR